MSGLKIKNQYYISFVIPEWNAFVGDTVLSINLKAGFPTKAFGNDGKTKAFRNDGKITAFMNDRETPAVGNDSVREWQEDYSIRE